MKAVKVKGVFMADTKRFHRFEIKTDDGFITGSLYFAKGEDVPDVVEVELQTKADQAKAEG